MSTNGADDPKMINPGEIITAAWLNSTRGPGTIVGADGVEVARAGNRLAIATRETSRAVPAGVVLGTIATEVGGGAYTWTRVGSGEGPASGTASEGTAATGIAVGTTITLHRTTGGLWWFYNAAAASSNTIGAVLEASGSVSIGGAGADMVLDKILSNDATVAAGVITIHTAGSYRIWLNADGTTADAGTDNAVDAYFRIDGTSKHLGQMRNDTAGSRAGFSGSWERWATLSDGSTISLRMTQAPGSGGSLSAGSQWGCHLEAGLT